MIRVLEVFREPLANGGQESFIMNMYRNMDRTRVQMDFLTPFTVDNPGLKKEIESLGGRVFSYDHPFGEDDNHNFRISLEDFLKNHRYNTVHFHSGSTYALMMGPKIAEKAGVKNRIVHSHCTGDADLKYYVIKTLSIPYFRKYTTQFCACSLLAAEWKFPKSVIRDGKVRILKNAVDLDRFYWDPEKRKKIRQDFGVVENTTVLGHIGRFSRQKNHGFLIDIFHAFAKRHPNSRLWLAGTGEEMDAVREKAKELQLEDRIDFLGLRKDVPELMNGMDAFVLPSLFEGLPVVGVEAQAVSLPVITSENVTRELPIADLSDYLPLGDEHLEQWVDAIEKALQTERKDRRKEMTEAGYDVRQAAAAMQQMYEEMEKKADGK